MSMLQFPQFCRNPHVNHPKITCQGLAHWWFTAIILSGRVKIACHSAMMNLRLGKARVEWESHQAWLPCDVPGRP